MWPFANSLFMVAATAILSFVAARYWHGRSALEAETAARESDNRERDAKIAELNLRLSVVTAAVVPISEAFKAVLIKELTHYHTPELDKLLAKIGPPQTLTDIEVIRLERLLDERSRDMADSITDSERDAATMLPMVIKRAKAEAIEPKVAPADALMQIVSLPLQSETNH